MKQSIEFIKKVVGISNDFELTNTDVKRQYFIENIKAFRNATKPIHESKGTFGTGYPFYTLNQDLRGHLPVVLEQLRYNNELASHADKSKHTEWKCASCLSEKGETMPDLKTICKICPEMDDELKPRKVINRLPDIDMWMIVEDKDIENASKELKKALSLYGFKTSDIDPIRTIFDLEDIVNKLKQDVIPKKKLPIDSHIIDRVTLYNLISQVPEKLEYCIKHGEIPYLPIHPLSLRKEWQKDDSAYNFVHDYLYGFHEFELDPSMQDVLDHTRKHIAENYSVDTLFDIATKTGNASVARRNETPALKEAFEGRIESWLEK